MTSVTWFAVPLMATSLSNKNAFLDLPSTALTNSIGPAIPPARCSYKSVNVLRIYPPPFPDFVPYDGYDLVRAR